MRRLRTDDWSRRLVRENNLCPDDLIYPIFVQEGEKKTETVQSMPGIERISLDLLVKEARHVESLGIPVIALFPVIPHEKKSLDGKEAFIYHFLQGLWLPFLIDVKYLMKIKQKRSEKK